MALVLKITAAIYLEAFESSSNPIPLFLSQHTSLLTPALLPKYLVATSYTHTQKWKLHGALQGSRIRRQVSRASHLFNAQILIPEKAPQQISAEQLLREAVDRQEPGLQAPTQRFADLEELHEFQGRKRKEFEDYVRRNRINSMCTLLL